MDAAALAPHFPAYEIQRLLGCGGMGAVYLARQTSLNRLVAIKILPADLDDGFNNFAERFKNEAQAMAQLSHPGIVAVYDFGQTENGLLYIVMEYVNGTDVQQMVAQQGRLHSAHAMAITAHVCDALAYAHSRGIIHRDIKPSNIMVSNDGVVKVADFGLAKMDQGGQGASLTQSGMAMGTLHFMAPEVLTLGAAVDQRADIYAVGVMLYQMLTGKLPQGLFEMPSLQVPGLDPRYDRIVAKALREDRTVRYQQASELRQDLDAILTQPVVKVEPEARQAPAAMPPPAAKPQRPASRSHCPPQHSAPPPPKKKSHTKLIFGGLALLVLIAAWVFLFVGMRTTTQPALASKTQPFVNSLGMKFVPVPGTNVLMCIHETRRQDYAAFAKEVPSVNSEWKEAGYEGIACGDQDNHPVAQVNWFDAQDYCAWLSKKEGKTYRLPTDREWSIAVGVGQEENWSASATPASVSKNPVLFPWGTEWPPPPGCGNYKDASWKSRAAKVAQQYLDNYMDDFPTTAPVMSFKPNALGLYDMGGNQWEWCEDWYDDNQHLRVLRGASWADNATWGPNDGALLGSFRARHTPNIRYPFNGFRVVLELDGGTQRPPSASDSTSAVSDPPNKARRVIDLIPTAKLLPASQVDIWQLKGTDLEFVKGGDIVFPHACGTQEYDLEFEFTVLTDAVNSIVHTFPTAKGRCILCMQLFREHPGPFWGFGILDNVHYAFAKEARVVRDYPPLFEAGKRYQTIVKVRDGSLEAYLNGRLLVHWKGDPSRFTTGETDLPHPRHPKFGIYDGRAIIHKATVTEFVPKTTSPATPVPTPSTAPLHQTNSTSRLDATTKEQPFVNSLGMKFVPVPGTKVLFCIHETRYQDYAAYAAVSPGVDLFYQHQSADRYAPTGRTAEHPVIHVSWEDAQKFLAWLSQKEGKTYRLPTDREWSIAAGIGRDETWEPGTTPSSVTKNLTTFPWGDQWPPPPGSGNYSDASRKAKAPRGDARHLDGYDDGFPTTAPVMSYPPNPFGLYDMGGNVWEFCADWYNALKKDRVWHGGAWDTYQHDHLLSSHRWHNSPSLRNSHIGFRCVLEISSQPAPASSKSVPKP